MIASVIGVYFAGVVCSFVHLTIKARKQRLKYGNISKVAENIDDNNYICWQDPLGSGYSSISEGTVTTLALVFPVTYSVWAMSSACSFIAWSFYSIQNIGSKVSDKIIAFTNKQPPQLPEAQHKTYRG